ncbi:hypothetical protein [Candidatus Epulonipiscium viviparus]|uniref:hypothetical protein n=1 Tax=Candidatus Epulonipiscium viviparus TaxID=420336 RepID=UPI00016C0D89|nr:hypothetical protein [Candidatus Epulopiscium viviparus]
MKIKYATVVEVGKKIKVKFHGESEPSEAEYTKLKNAIELELEVGDVVAFLVDNNQYLCIGAI